MTVKKEIEQQDWEDYYRSYQVTLAERFLIPSLRDWGDALEGKRFLEIGCGDGGCGLAFARAGCDVVMMDVDERLVEIARRANERDAVEIPTFVGDVFDSDADFYREGPFDIVLFRDVMEHLEDPARAIGIVGRYLAPGGRIFVVFPPYFSPYGAHQQIVPRKTVLGLPYNKLPFIQLLPRRCFLRMTGGSTGANREVARLRDIRLTIAGFERAVTRAGFRVRNRKTYLSRPTFSLRYGIPVVPAGPIGRIPLLRELFVTAAYYLIEKNSEE